MESPQHRRIPHAMHSPGRVAPINLGLPLHAADPAPGNNPFLAPPAPALAPAPAPAPVPALAPAPAIYNGHQFNHLPAALAQKLAALPPMPLNLGQGNGRGHGHGRGRGRGRGHGRGYGEVPAPAPAVIVCVDIMHLSFSHTV